MDDNSWTHFVCGVVCFTISNVINTFVFKWFYNYGRSILYPKVKKSICDYVEGKFITIQRKKLFKYRNKRHLILFEYIDNIVKNSNGDIQGDLQNICKLIEMYLDIYMQNQDIFDKKLTDSYIGKFQDIDYYFDEKDKFCRVNEVSKGSKKDE